MKPIFHDRWFQKIQGGPLDCVVSYAALIGFVLKATHTVAFWFRVGSQHLFIHMIEGSRSFLGLDLFLYQSHDKRHHCAMRVIRFIALNPNIFTLQNMAIKSLRSGGVAAEDAFFIKPLLKHSLDSYLLSSGSFDRLFRPLNSQRISLVNPNELIVRVD